MGRKILCVQCDERDALSSKNAQNCVNDEKCGASEKKERIQVMFNERCEGSVYDFLISIFYSIFIFWALIIAALA